MDKTLPVFSPRAILFSSSPGGGADWRLLNGGWMFADGILLTGEILRQEPCTPYFTLLDCQFFNRLLSG